MANGGHHSPDSDSPSYHPSHIFWIAIDGRSSSVPYYYYYSASPQITQKILFPLTPQKQPSAIGLLYNGLNSSSHPIIINAFLFILRSSINNSIEVRRSQQAQNKGNKHTSSPLKTNIVLLLEV
jgi:hypothetical protein